MHGLSLIYILRDLPGLKSFKVIQESLALTRVLLIPEAGFPADAQARIVAGFKRRLGEGVQIDVSIVDAIPPEKSGKFRYIVSHALPPR
jgi:phenylacetate-CoA ligase